MPLEYAQEITRLHKLYIQGKLDPLTVVTTHRTIRAHQRKAAIAGRLGEAVSGGEMWDLVYEETLQELDRLEIDHAEGGAEAAKPDGSDDPYSGPFTECISKSGSADGRYGAVVRGGFVARVQPPARPPTRPCLCVACACCCARI